MYGRGLVLACIASILSLAGCAPQERRSSEESRAASLNADLGNDFTGNYLWVHGTRSIAVDAKYPCLNEVETCLPLDRTGRSTAVMDLCPSVDTPEGTWTFEYALHTAPDCTQPLGNMMCVIDQGATLAPGENHTNVACLTSNAVTDFQVCVYDPVSGAGRGRCSEPPPDATPSDAKEITQLTILGVNGVISEPNIVVTVPSGTDLTALVPTITFTGTSIWPESGVAQDFTAPVVYTVTAADGSTRDYVVTVVPAAPGGYDFSCAGAPEPATAPDPITIAGTLADAMNRSAVANATVLARRRGDDSLLGAAMSAADGTFVVSATNAAMTPADLYVQFTSGAYLPTYFYPAGPLADNTANLDVGMMSPGAMSFLYGIVGVGYDPNDATGVIVVMDCAGNRVAGATVTVTPAPRALLYVSGALPSRTPTATDSTGTALAFALPYGDVTVAASYMGTPLKTHTFRGWPSSVSLTYVSP